MKMSEAEWYRQMDANDRMLESKFGHLSNSLGQCGSCRHTGTLGSGEYGPRGVAGYWCSRHSMPVGGRKTCSNWTPDC
jgi:hypothetical protein